MPFLSSDEPPKTSFPKRVARSCDPARNVVFLKTHKTGGSTVFNLMMRYAVENNLVVALPVSPKHFQIGLPSLFQPNMVPILSLFIFLNALISCCSKNRPPVQRQTKTLRIASLCRIIININYTQRLGCSTAAWSMFAPSIKVNELHWIYFTTSCIGFIKPKISVVRLDCPCASVVEAVPK